MSSNSNFDYVIKHFNNFRETSLKKIARWAYRRRIPSNIRRAVLSLWNNRCAICGLKDGDTYRNGSSIVLEIAHIEPAEEGGEIAPVNLIPLCKRAYRSLLEEAHEKRKTIEDIGCHHLYDNEGTWSRQQIRELDYCSNHQTGVSRPKAIKRLLPLTLSLKERVEHKLSWPNKGKNPLPEIKSKLQAGNLKWSERLDLLICGLRLARRPFPQNFLCNLPDEVNFFSTALSKLEMKIQRIDEKERIWYEKAMVHFEFTEFDKALKLLRMRKNAPNKKSASLINKAHACVCEFEIERTKNTLRSNRIRKIIHSLDEIIPDLDKLAKRKTSWGAWKTWPVTARLHVARMKAYLDDATAWKDIKDAVEIRDQQINSDVWKYSLDEHSQEFKNVESRSGWSRYTQVLLLHAKGESLRACAKVSASLACYQKATEFLALAARRIIQDRYKNFEYLDNVLEGLQKIPNGVTQTLDEARNQIAVARYFLFDLRRCQRNRAY
ncbi:MAG: hypothetical protein WA126_07500 [Thermodesulfovibrionales bacterium]